MPIPTKIKRNTGLAGIADVRVLPDSLLVQFVNGQQFQVSNEGWERDGGRFNISMSANNDKIKFVSPPGRPEPYLVKFDGFGNKPNGVPEPIHVQADYKNYGDGAKLIPAHDEMAPKLRVLEKGLYYGLIISNRLPYIFEKADGQDIAALNGTGGQIKRIEEFLRVTGFDPAKRDIPWPPDGGFNVLPWLEVELLSLSKVFTVTLNDRSFVQSLGQLPFGIDPKAILGEDEPVKKNGKKPAAKTPAKSKAKSSKK